MFFSFNARGRGKKKMEKKMNEEREKKGVRPKGGREGGERNC
jgi:hypothetical protein